MRMIRTLLAAALMWLSAAPAFAMDCSGTITLGGTAQNIFSGPQPRRIMLMNNSANLMCVGFSGVAATIAGTNCGAGSWALQPGSATLAGGSFVNPPDMYFNFVSIISSTTGDRFSCERQ